MVVLAQRVLDVPSGRLRRRSLRPNEELEIYGRYPASSTERHPAYASERGSHLSLHLFYTPSRAFIWGGSAVPATRGLTSKLGFGTPTVFESP